MSQKNTKKLRQMYRREITPLVRERVDMMTKHVLGNRPRFMPLFVWKSLVKLVLKV